MFFFYPRRWGVCRYAPHRVYRRWRLRVVLARAYHQMLTRDPERG